MQHDDEFQDRMKIEQSELDGITVLALHGRFIGDLDVDDYCDTVRERIEAGASIFIVDLAGIDYINSMGLGALIAGYVMVMKSGGKAAYAGANQLVRELLELTKTDSAVPVYETIATARAALTGAQ